MQARFKSISKQCVSVQGILFHTEQRTGELLPWNNLSFRNDFELMLSLNSFLKFFIQNLTGQSCLKIYVIILHIFNLCLILLIKMLKDSQT